MTSYGKNIRISVYGGSHDPEIGLTAEGIPQGIAIDEDSVRAFMKRRAPGAGDLSTARKEADELVFLSGVENGTTDGGTLKIVIKNTDARSGDYPVTMTVPRPSHADYPAYVKYRGPADLRGGGHFSGRLTALLCALGAILTGELERRGVTIGAHILRTGDITDEKFDPVGINAETLRGIKAKEFPTLSDSAGKLMKSRIALAGNENDSVGGVIECAAVGLEPGVGEHMFSGMEFSIPAVKGVDFGIGFDGVRMSGSEYNDSYYTDGKSVFTETNNSGGICGGMTTGMPLVFRAAVKPTPSIGIRQRTVDLSDMTNTEITVGGRHDPCILPRAVPVVEAACAIAVFDAMLDTDDVGLMER